MNFKVPAPFHGYVSATTCHVERWNISHNLKAGYASARRRRVNERSLRRFWRGVLDRSPVLIDASQVVRCVLAANALRRTPPMKQAHTSDPKCRAPLGHVSPVEGGRRMALRARPNTSSVDSAEWIVSDGRVASRSRFWPSQRFGQKRRRLISIRDRSSLAVAALALALGCAPEEAGRPTGAVCPDNSTISYTDFVAEFVANYCAECHSSSVVGAARKGAPSDHNFDTVYDIVSNGDHLDELAGVGPDSANLNMPPEGYPDPTVEERAKLSEWLACKAAGKKEPN
jgi:hypothetical protein